MSEASSALFLKIHLALQELLAVRQEDRIVNGRIMLNEGFDHASGTPFLTRGEDAHVFDTLATNIWISL